MDSVCTVCMTDLILMFVAEERLIYSAMSSSAYTDSYSEAYRLIFP